VRGLAADWLFWAIFALLPLALWSAINLLSRMDALFRSLPVLLHTIRTPERDAIRIEPNVRNINRFVYIQSSNSKEYYRYLLVVAVMAYVLVQLVNPLYLRFSERSWALSPYTHSLAYAVACFWSLFWTLLVTDLFWVVFSSTISVFRLIREYAKDGHIIVSTLLSKQANALATVGDFSMAVALFFSFLAAILIPWIVIFIKDSFMQLAYVIVYIIAMVIIGVIPFVIVRNSIRHAQYNYLTELGTEFNLQLQRFISRNRGNINAISDTESAELMKNLASIETMYNRIDKISQVSPHFFKRPEKWHL
jgi:hypothetical protein